MKRLALTAQLRKQTGTSPNRRLRGQGKIPAILYGQTDAPLPLAIDAHAFSISTAKTGDEIVMFDLSVPESSLPDQLIMIREAQRDPVTERIVHLDMLRVDPNKPIDVVVPVHPEGTPVGILQGGQLEHVMRTVHLRCLIADIPDHITVNITDLSLGQAFHVRDLQMGDRVEILSHPNDVLFLLAAPRKEEEAPVAAAAAAVEGAEPAKPGEEKKKEEEKKK